MGRPRIHKDNAAKQKAYRERKKRREARNVTSPASALRPEGERWFQKVIEGRSR